MNAITSAELLLVLALLPRLLQMLLLFFTAAIAITATAVVFGGLIFNCQSCYRLSRSENSLEYPKPLRHHRTRGASIFREQECRHYAKGYGILKSCVRAECEMKALLVHSCQEMVIDHNNINIFFSKYFSASKLPLCVEIFGNS